MLCPRCGQEAKKSGKTRNGNQRYAHCLHTFVEFSPVDGRYTPAEKQEEVKRLFMEHHSVREIMAATGLAKNTVQSFRKELTLPPCPCGKPAGHLGFCSFRISKCPGRQEFMKTFGRAPAAHHNGLRPGAFYFGFCFGQSLHSSEVPRGQKCKARSCVMPKWKGDWCFHHEHFFDFCISMTGHALDIADMFDADHPTETLLSIVPYWEHDVDKLEKTLRIEPVGFGGYSVTRASGHTQVVYDRDNAPINNVQQPSGRRIYKGWGKKKIRKKQRQRPAGWHGSRSKHDVFKRYTRETLEDHTPELEHLENECPKPEINLSQLEEHERQTLINQLVAEQSSDQAEWSDMETISES